MLSSAILFIVFLAPVSCDGTTSRQSLGISSRELDELLGSPNKTCSQLFSEPSVVDGCEEAKRCLLYFSRPVSFEALQSFCTYIRNSSYTLVDESGEWGRPSSGEVWGYGLLCVTLISLTSVLGAGILPLMSRSFFSYLLSSLIGLAVGSLSGSAIFHLIPSAFRLSDVSFYPHHSYLSISLAVWLGLYLFFIIERFLKIFMDAKARSKGEVLEHAHSHLQHNGPESGNKEKEKLLVSVSGCTLRTEMSSSTGKGDKRDPAVEGTDQADQAPENGVKAAPKEISAVMTCTEGRSRNSSTCLDGVIVGGGESAQCSRAIYEHNQSAIRASFGHVDRPHPATRPTVAGVKSLERGSSKVATVAWMIIFGDGIHNFIDGLSIGAGFSESILTGISISLAVLCEEFPHELGDFAVLLNAGMTMKQALLYNFLSACTCYIGLVLGILLGELDANVYIFGLAGGMFLYISLVDMVPEMNECVETASKQSVSKALGIFFLQNVGILVGIVCLYTLARFQDDIQFTYN